MSYQSEDYYNRPAFTRTGAWLGQGGAMYDAKYSYLLECPFCKHAFSQSTVDAIARGNIAEIQCPRCNKKIYNDQMFFYDSE